MDIPPEAMHVSGALAEDEPERSRDRPAGRRPEPGATEPVADEGKPRLSWNRLDLAIKLRYLGNAFTAPSAFSAQLYDEHLRAMSSGGPGADRQAEPGLSRNDFEELCRTLRADGSGSPAGRVVLASDGTVLTGAHEVACAMFLDRAVRLSWTALPPAAYDYRYFQSRGMSGEHLDAAVLRFVEHAPDCFVALIWPAAQGHDEEIERILGPLVYRKAVSLETNGAHNLLSQVYAGEPWLGDPAKNYPGIQHKLVECFARSGPLRVAVFQNPSLEDVLAAKQAVRDRFGIGKHSIHITDTHEEAVQVARLLLNDRSVHFLNSARPTRFPSTLRMVAGFEGFLRRRGVPPGMAVVDSGMVLAAYGLREAGDVDFISPLEVEDEDLFSRHGPGAHGLPVGDLLDDPRNHFHFWGLKFVSLEQVERMKRRRKEGRDVDDLGLIGPVLASRSASPRLRAVVNRLRFLSAKGRRRLVQATKRLGLHGPLKAAQRRIRGRAR